MLNCEEEKALPNIYRSTCPICRSDNIREFHVFSRLQTHVNFVGYQRSEIALSPDGAGEPLMICRECHGVFRRDLIDFKELFKNYHDRFEDFSRDQVISRIEDEYSRLASDPTSKYVDEWNFIQKHLNSTYGKCKCATLDIGSREGVIPRALKKDGHTANLIEPTKALVNVLKEICGIEAKCALFEKGAYPDESFDLISAMEVVHRVDHPLDFTIAAFEQLKPNGLLMLGLNNIYDLGLNYLTQQHRIIFSPYTAEILLRKSGFEVLEMRAVPGTTRIMVMARKKEGVTPPPFKKFDSLFRLKTFLLRAEFGRTLKEGPRHEFIDAIAFRLLMLLGR